MLNYRNLSIATSLLTAGLFVLYFAMPQIMMAIFGIESDEAAEFVSRRASVLFLALSAIACYGRNAENSVARQAICFGGVVGMTCMAALGLFEFARGVAGIGTLAIVAVEVGFGVAFWRVWSANRPQF